VVLRPRPGLDLLLPAVSLIATTVGAVAGWGGGLVGLAEVGALLWLLGRLTRTATTVREAGAGAAAAVALLVLPLRVDDGGDRSAAIMLLALLAAVVVGAALLLRRRAAVRSRREAAVRAQERAAIAAELHDVATHHLTAVLLQAQVAGRLAPDDARLPTALRQVEQEAARSLDALRTLVGVLHVQPTASREPADTLDALAGLVEAWNQVGPTVHLDLPDPLPTLAPAPSAAVVRVVRESLTNVRRHAPEATRVDVRLRITSQRVVLEIADDGGPAAREPLGGHGGLGLVGLTERLDALGGHLVAGPGDGGWTVTGTLPLTVGTGR
jgi:signal transduction histidine kinase